MKEVTIRAAECDVCSKYTLCWHISLADVCSDCLSTVSAAIDAVADHGIIDLSTTEAPKARRKAGGK